METNVATDRDYELWVLLEQACDAMRRAWDNELREFGISRMQAAVLLIVKVIKGQQSLVRYRAGCLESLTQCRDYWSA